MRALTRRFRLEVRALYLACKDSRTPWYAKVVALSVVGYALSPVDLIPDGIPVLGYLDDLVIVPLGVILAVRLIPPEVLADCRERAREETIRRGAAAWIAGGLIVLFWLALASAGVGLILWATRGGAQAQ